MSPVHQESDPWRAGTGQTSSPKMSGRAAQPRHRHTPLQLCCDTGQSYFQKAAWAGTVLGSLMAFLLLAWRWSHQFDNVISPQLFGFSPTSLNCSAPPPPQRPSDASYLLLPLTSLGFHSADSSQVLILFLLFPHKDPGAINGSSCSKI